MRDPRVQKFLEETTLDPLCQAKGHVSIWPAQAVSRLNRLAESLRGGSHGQATPRRRLRWIRRRRRQPQHGERPRTLGRRRLGSWARPLWRPVHHCRPRRDGCLPPRLFDWLRAMPPQPPDRPTLPNSRRWRRTRRPSLPRT